MTSLKATDDSNSEVAHINRNSDVEAPSTRQQLEKQLLRKLDIRMSFLVILMILNIIDRNNTPAARLRGFEHDLHLNSRQYSTVLSILFVGYILMQIPSNMIMNYFGKPSIYLSTCTILWGLVSVFTGLTTSFTGAVFCRFFLGAIEAAFIPGALLLLSKWYKRDEVGLRSAILFCGSFISNAFGSLLASWILDTMESKLGQAAWRWLFYIEGAITVTIASCGFFIIPDFPDTPTRWLTVEQQQLARKRMEEEAGLAHQGQNKIGHWDGFIMSLTDWKVWWITLVMTLVQLSFSFAIFFPTLTATLGYSRTTTLLLCAPPWILATFVAFAVLRHSDYTCERGYHSIVPAAAGLLGFLIAMCTMNIVARYASLFLMAVMPIGGMCIMAWAITSLQPANKRAVGIALINGVSQLALVAGPYAWDQSWGPSYRYSFAICVVASSISIIMTLVFRHHLVSLNAKAQKEEEERGQMEPGFRYML